MQGKTHIAFAIAGAITYSQIKGISLDETNLTMLSAGATLGGLLPDIDHAQSKLGSKIPILPHLLKHRGITHTVYFLVLMYLITIVTTLPYIFEISLLIGVLSHLVGDLLTPAGLRLIAPLNRFWLGMPIIQNKMIENMIFIGLSFYTVSIIGGSTWFVV